MDVFPEILGDKEFSYFTPADYVAVKNILNGYLAKYIKDYMESEYANPAVVNSMQYYLGDVIESYTLHYVMEERGITDLVRTLVPESLAVSGQDLDDLIEKLTFLEQNESKLLTSTPPRTREAWDTFFSAIKGVLLRISQSNDAPTYPDIVERIADNQYMFYTVREKAQDTGTRIFSLRKRQWLLALRGAQYLKRCNTENIPYNERRRF